MTDYPEDILRAAEEAASLVARHVSLDTWGNYLPGPEEFTDIIASALAAERERGAKAERERCAQIADKADETEYGNSIAASIAAAIRGEKP